MKKNLLLIAAITLGTVTFVSASNADKQNQAVQPSRILMMQDTVKQRTESLSKDEFVPVKIDALNEKVQVAIKILAEKYDFTALSFNEAKQITKIEATLKSDKSPRTILLDAEGKEIEGEQAK